MAKSKDENSKQDSKSSTEQKPSLGKIRLDTSCLQQSSGGGGCPMEKLVYVFFAIVAVLYAAHLADKESFSKYAQQLNAGFLSEIFTFIDNYSPFNEALESDEELIEKLRKQAAVRESGSSGIKIYSVEELKKYDGSPGSPGLYIALLGVVYDVAKGAQYYGPGGGYSFFAGRDASRAYVTGNFEEAGLVSNVDGLSSGDYLGLEEWSRFYEKDYSKVGVLNGLFYDSNGDVTQHWKDLQTWMAKAREDRDKDDVEKKMFPPCNVEWNKDEGSRFWCTVKSGGIHRDWRGVPRKLFYPGQQPRCACIRESGPPSTDPGAKTNRGDLDSPHIKEYPGCEKSSWECRGVKEN